MIQKTCPRCGERVPTNEWNRHQQHHRNEGKNTTTRGYGSDHRKLRKQWEQHITTYGQVPCRRCGEPILAGEDWDLGHDDAGLDPSAPEHSGSCNRATAGRISRLQRFPQE